MAAQHEHVPMHDQWGPGEAAQEAQQPGPMDGPFGTHNGQMEPGVMVGSQGDLSLVRQGEGPPPFATYPVEAEDSTEAFPRERCFRNW